MRPVDAPTLEQAIHGIGFWFRKLTCSREEMIGHLGTPHWTESEEGLGDYHHWVFVASCGLRIAYCISAEGESDGSISLSLPEDDHFLRHDPWFKDRSYLANADSARETEGLIQELKEEYPELTRLADFQVYRMGDDGNEMKIGFPTSEIDAKCFIAELESHKHKQIYWYTELRKPNSDGADR